MGMLLGMWMLSSWPGISPSLPPWFISSLSFDFMFVSITTFCANRHPSDALSFLDRKSRSSLLNIVTAAVINNTVIFYLMIPVINSHIIKACTILCTMIIYMSEELVKFPAAWNLRDLEAFFRKERTTKQLP